MAREREFIRPLVEDLFVVDALYRHGDRIAVSLSYRFERDRSRKLLEERLDLSGYEYELNPGENSLLLTVNPKRRLRIPLTNIILFVATLVTVYFVSVLARYGSWDGTIAALKEGAGIEFTLALISMLFVHEMGHFIASRRRGIVTSWPYFIPAPNIIGTFGAIIKSKSPFWNRRDLIEVGAMGPIAGWVVALGWLIYGLSQSTIVAVDNIPVGQLGFFLEGESILMHALMPVLVGTAGPDSAYVVTEAAFAGWVGLLVTAINLLPVGQFDGGHIVYGLVPDAQKTLGWIAMIGLLVAGFQSPMWWLFAAFGLVFGVAHPPTLDDDKPIGGVAKGLGIAAIVILIISFTPVPFRI